MKKAPRAAIAGLLKREGVSKLRQMEFQKAMPGISVKRITSHFEI